MKDQTSMEFLIILGAISLLILFAAVQYGRVLGEGRSIGNVSYSANVLPQDTKYFQRPYLEVSMPAYSSPYYQDSMGIAAYGCTNGTIGITINSSDIVFSYVNISSPFYSAQTWNDNFDPSPGVDSAQVRYSMLCSGSAYNGTYTVNTEYQEQGQEGDAYSAYLFGRNESVIYGTQRQSVVSITSGGHCTYQTWDYATVSILGKCSTDDAWEYMVSSSICSSNGGPFTQTTCLYPTPTGYNISSPNQSVRYAYSFNLSIVYGAETLSSRISSSNAVAPVYYLGQVVGNASVANVTSAQAQPSIAMISGPQPGSVNSTYLGEYEQARESLYGLLAYYNSSWISGDIESQIQQAISEYGDYESGIISAANLSSKPQCIMLAGAFDCQVSYPLYYIIDAKISPRYLQGNQTISYEGSVIRVTD